MAITWAAYRFFKELRDEGRSPLDPAVLELGQANWYGDIDPACLVDDVRQYARPEEVDYLLGRLWEPGTSEEPRDFIRAKVFYGAVLRPVAMNAIDLNGTPRAIKYDLNRPIEELGRMNWSVIINSGTAEHIWNQDQFFRTAHDACRSNGIMVHFLPAWGWLDHGFYNYHPTFVADLSTANEYEIVKWWLHDMKGTYVPVHSPADARAQYHVHGLSSDTMYAVCYRKTTDAPFRMPMQGHYAKLCDIPVAIEG